MAISGSSVFEIRSTATAANVNGGFFVTGASGTDYSQQNAAQYNLTGVTSAGAGNVVLTASAAADMVGNGAFVVSGTNFTSGATVGRFEILSVVVGVSITFGTNQAGTSITVGVGAAGVINIGGALSLGSNDDAVFEVGQPGNRFYIAAGNYTRGGTVSIGAAGGAQNPIVIEGYAVTRGDRPTGSTRPFLDGTGIFTFGTAWILQNLRVSGDNTAVVTIGAGGYLIDSKVINYSQTADRSAVILLADTGVINCECTSINGRGISSTVSNNLIFGCYIHDCKDGYLSTSATSNIFLINNIIESCFNTAVNVGADVSPTRIIGNTLYGSENTTGTGVSFATGATDITIMNNVIYGFVTGVSHADTQSIGQDAFNDYFNNDANVSAAGQWQIGATSLLTSPGLSGVAQITGATATTTAGVLSQAGANFSTVTDNVDYVYVSAGTGVTAGQYLITAHTTTTLTLSPAISANATADKVFQITTGRSFVPGTNLKDQALPVSTFIGGLTPSYVDIGGVQSRYGSGVAPGSGGGGGNRNSLGPKRIG